MKRSIFFSCGVLIFLFLITNYGIAQEIPAFPGAQGFGKYAKGGRGGKVIKVSNLNDSGPGSLRNALEVDSPRIVIFEVGGLIDLETPIIITNPYLTIAGQTAPGDGIAIRGNGIRVHTHDVIIRFLRIRPGDVSFGPENGWSGIDALTIGSSNINSGVHDIIIDHCSLSWAIDENFDIWNRVKNVTIQNSIVSEALANNKHHKGEHSKGILIGEKSNRITILANLLAHNNDRNPRVSNVPRADIINNVIYNPGAYGLQISNWRKQKQHINIIKNKFVSGPNTKFENEISVWEPKKEYNGEIYLNGNWGFGKGLEGNNWEMVEYWQTRKKLIDNKSIRADSSSPINNVDIQSHFEVEKKIKKFVGAFLPKRDAIDKRIIKNYSQRTGKVINSQHEVGGWPVYRNGPVRKDSNDNGLPDGWEEEYNIAGIDVQKDYDNDGYSNIEEYINGTDPRNASNSIINSSRQINGAFTNGDETASSNIELNQNFPNPFSDFTKIQFKVSHRKRTWMAVYNTLGQKVNQLVDTTLLPGEYEVVWSPTQLSAGSYLIRLRVNGEAESKAITYIK